jgi:hypothetical protein
MAETKGPRIVEENFSDSGLPQAIRDAVQQFVVALAQRLKISKPVVAEKMVGCGLDMMVSYLSPEVVAHWLRRCADQLEAEQAKQNSTAR